MVTGEEAVLAAVPDQGGEPHFHMSGAPGAVPVMRNIHHSQPPQPTTPPNLQDLKSPASHMQNPPMQAHQIPPHLQQQQQHTGPQQIYLPMNRQGGPPTQFQRGGPGGSNRPPRPNLMQGQSYGPGQHGQVPYPNMAGLAQPTVSVMNFALPQGPGNRFHVPGYPNTIAYQYLPVYQQPPMVRPQLANSQILMPQQQQPVPPGVLAQPIEQATSRGPAKKRQFAIKIVDPDDGSDVIENYMNEQTSSTTPGSGQSSARETPQLQATNSEIAMEFARKVASTLGDEAVIRPGSRNSINSESDPQTNNEVQQPNTAHESISLAKLEPSPENVVVTAVVPNEMPLVENNMEYAPPQQREVPRWPIIPPMEPDPMCVPASIQPHVMVLTSGPDDLMNPVLHQPRGYRQGWPQEPPQMPPGQVLGPAMVPPMGMPNTVAPVHVPPPPVPSVKKPERSTPVVSALANAPLVDISRDYPALGGQRHGSHHQSPARKRRPNKPDVEPSAERAASPSTAVPVSVPATAAANIPAAVVTPVAQPEPVVAEAKPDAPPTVTSAPADVSRHSSPNPVSVPVTVEETKQQPAELPAPQHAPTSVPPVEAKANHQKSKSNKRQQQRHEQTRPVTPVAAVPPAAVVAPETVVEPTKPAPARASSPAVDRSPAPVLAPAQVPAATQPARDPSPALAPKVSPVVDEEAQIVANMKLQDSKPESLLKDENRDENIVAAMNEENEKLTASNNKLANINNADLDNKTKNNIQENNNVPNVTVVVEPATPAPEPTPVIETPKPFVLKHPYKDDQWSPLNRDGKKQYGRDFLIALQNEPQSKKRPDNLPELEVLRDLRPGGSMRGSLPSQRSDSGPYMNKSSSLRGNSGGGRDSGHLKRASLLGKQKSQKPMAIQLSLSLNEDVKLRETESPWKPVRNIDTTEANMTEDEKTELLYKKFRGILNKLTPQKFNKLTAQVKDLPINTPARLEGVIKLVFEKAVDEPGFSETYADLCSKLSKLTAEEANFRVMLLYRCQQLFEKNDNQSGINREERLKEVESETDPEKKKEMLVQLEEDERKVRVKAVGNVRFIGELYKMKMLHTSIMFVCIDHLLKLGTEESLECLCKLLTTIGQSLEEEVAKARSSMRNPPKDISKEDLDKLGKVADADLLKCFNHLEALVKNKSKKISSRVRFMIQDLIDLREQRWVPRREDTAPKTVDQIVKDAEREQMEATLALSAAGLDNRRMGGSGGRQDSRNTMDNRNRRDAHAWQTQQGYSKNRQYVEPNKLRVNQTETDLNDGMSLGSRNQFLWARGSGSVSDERKQSGGGFSITQNKYALLEEKPTSRSSSLKGNSPSGNELRENRDRPARPSLHDESRSSRNNQQFNKSSSVSRDVTTPVTPAETPAPGRQKNVPGPPILDPDAIERAAKNMIDEFTELGDYAEAVATLEEKFAESIKGDMILNLLITSLERSEASRRSVGKVLAHFLKIGAITQAQFIEGLKGFKEQADDLIVDIPRLWDYLPQMIADIVAEGCSLAVILDVLGPPTNKSTLNVVAAILRFIVKNRPDSPSLASSVPVLRSYFGSAALYQSFIKDNKLEFLETKKIDEAQVTNELVAMMRRHEAFDKITDWIDKKFEKAAYELPFIKALTNAFLEFGLSQGKSGSWKLETESLNRYVNIMSRYVDNQPERELQCLFCIQAKMNKLEHPQGMLCEICTFLIDSGTTSAESFKSWKTSNDPRGMEGHGVCMASLVSFFTMIEEDDDDAPTS